LLPRTVTKLIVSANGSSLQVRKPGWPRSRAVDRWAGFSSGSTASSVVRPVPGIPTSTTTTTQSTGRVTRKRAIRRELCDLENDRSHCTDVAEQPRQRGDVEEPLVLLRRHPQRPPPGRPDGKSSVLASGPRGNPERTRCVCSTRTAHRCPNKSGVVIGGRSYTIAAGVTLDSVEASARILRRQRRRATLSVASHYS
jgi:hypothetical protein